MSSYYNEIDPFAAQWLRNLMAAGHIPQGEVDERSIADVSPDDLRQFRQCHFFAGIGGWAYAARLAGWPDDRELWTGSCPCQPFSAAGKQAGMADERHLWPTWLRLIRERHPVNVFGEQVAAAIGREWLALVQADLESEGYRVGATVLGAHSVGAPHIRQRLYFGADPVWNKQSRQEPRSWAAGRVGRVQQPVSWDAGWQDALARLRALDDGVPRCVAGTDAARNAIVPALAAEVISAYMEAAA